MVCSRLCIATICAGAILPCLAITNHQSSIINAQEIPTVGRPTANFYNAQGNPVRVEWRLDRTTVPEDEDIVATLVVTGAINPREIIRPDLGKLEPFASRFIIPETRDPIPVADAKEVRFTYRLRPRNRSVDSFPTLAFHYYNPANSEGKKFPLTTAKFAGKLTVTAPRPRAEPPPLPLGEHEWLLAFKPQPVSLSSPAFSGNWTWIAIGLLGPLAALGWYFAWQRVYPDAARLARMRRTRAARRATDAIRRAGRAPDPHATIANAVLGYLRARFPLSTAAATPGEIGAALLEVGLPSSESNSVADFFRACDAARFARPGERDLSLAIDAGALIARLEAA